MNRNVIIDTVRGIAVILVMFTHLVMIDVNNAFGTGILTYLKRGGWIGVDLFFVLSGYLVSGLLFNEYKKYNSINSGRFLLRRAFKIYPAFWCMIAVTFVIHYLKNRHFWSIESTNFIGEILFLQNYVGYVWSHTWSLAVEEHFYLFLTLLLFILYKQRMIRLNVILTVYVLLLVIGTGFRFYYNSAYPEYDFYKQYAYSHIRMDALFFGVLLSYCTHFHLSLIDALRKYRMIIIPIALIAVSLNFIYDREVNPWISVYMLSVNPIAFGLLLILMIYSERLKKVKNNFLSYIGRFSYSIYLWHMPINSLLFSSLLPIVFKRLHMPFNNAIYIACYFVFSLLIGVLLSKVIEYPVLKLRDKLMPSKTKGAL